MGCGSGMTCWRCLRGWHEAGVWTALHHVLLDRLGVAGEVDRSRASPDAQAVPAPGTAKRRLARPVVDRWGTPLAFCLTGANTNDSMVFETLLNAIPAVRPGAHNEWVG